MSVIGLSVSSVVLYDVWGDEHHIHMRHCEHKCIRTSVRLAKHSNSYVRNHAELSKHPISLNDFKVVSVYTKEDHRLPEAFYINKFSPKLNVQDGSVPLNILFRMHV